jgi:hypothetical protein
MSIDETIEILHDGTKEQIESLKSVSYWYYPDISSFTVRTHDREAHCHGATEAPNCVKYFGNEHVFAA